MDGAIASSWCCIAIRAARTNYVKRGLDVTTSQTPRPVRAVHRSKTLSCAVHSMVGGSGTQLRTSRIGASVRRNARRARGFNADIGREVPQLEDHNRFNGAFGGFHGGHRCESTIQLARTFGACDRAKSASTERPADGSRACRCCSRKSTYEICESNPADIWAQRRSAGGILL
jgi:hypothetical protein